MARVIGAGKHTNRLIHMSRHSAIEVAKRLYKVGQDIELDAEFSITAGSVSGEGHFPSKPGEPPNADTRHLDTNIETKLVDTYRPSVTVTSHADYSAALEYGTERMAARPFMRPALEKNKKQVVEAARLGVNIALSKSGRSS